MGRTNIDTTTGIRFGVISMHEVTQAWCDSSEGDYGEPTESECGECGKVFPVQCAYGTEMECPHCGEITEIGLPDFAEPLAHYVDDGEYKAAQSSDDRDIFILKSPYFTRAAFCSPCAPGACYLMSPDDDGEKAYCFGHDWFEDGKAPYPVYSVATGALINP